MEFNIEHFKKNKNFIFIIIIIVVLSFCFMFINNSKKYNGEIEQNGDEKVSGLVINEFMSSNEGIVNDPNGKNYDWIELYNGSSKDINLKNYGLSDKEDSIKWIFPDVVIKSDSYLLIYLSGTNDIGMYANFKLSSSGGETLELKDTNGKRIDSVKTESLNKNTVMARNLDGKWAIYDKPTPGYANTMDGYNLYLESIKDYNSDVKINEILPRNEGNFSIDGNYYGYIEIINLGDKTVNLSGYSISDTWDVPFKYELANIDLKPNEVHVVYMGDKKDEINYFSGFNLESNTGVALLSYNGKVVDEVKYNDLTNGYALVRNETFDKSIFISPGYPNTTLGSVEFSNKFILNKKDLMINEVMNSNGSYLAQNGGEYYDWIEFKNNSKETINLSNYYITTNINNKTMYKLPDMELRPNEFYILMASGDENLSNSSYKHANFKISKSESLYLIKDNNIVDSIFVASVPTGHSIGRNDKSGFYYFSTPTPKSNNKTGIKEISSMPIFDIKSGVYNGIDNMLLNISSKGAVYYTLDGSIPNTSSKKYTAPISLNKTTVVKAISYEDGKINSEVVVGSYIINENHKFPVVSVSLNSNDFKKVNNNVWSTDVEVKAHAELYEDGKSFSIPCGFKLFGGSTRGLSKKSFALKFRKQYGESELHYQVFDNRDFSTFNTLVLRSGSQDSERAFFRDILMTSLADGLINVDVQSYKTVILYINGQYWGVYNIREKIDDEFISNHYNVEEDTTDIINILRGVDEGSAKNYNSLVSYISSHDLSIKENYDYVASKLDMLSFVDFWIAETWAANNDILNARFFSNPNIENGKFKMIFYDLDYGMYNISHNYFDFTVNPEGMSAFKVSTLFMRKLVKNSEFRQLYLERLNYQLKNVWNEERVLEKIDELYNNLYPEMKRNQDRWNLTMDTWNERVEFLRTYTKQRTKYIKSHAKSFFNLSNEEYRKYLGDV